MKRVPLLFSASIALTTLILTSCGSSEPVPSSETTNQATEGTTSYPLTVENCGRKEIFTEVPQRVVSLDQGATEILLSLGLQDKIVGTASWTDPILPTLATANKDVPRISNNAPTYEAALDADPDFVVASFGRHYKAEGGVASRERWAETGVNSYLSYTDCEGPLMINGGGTRTIALTTDKIYQDIETLAIVFDVPHKGEELIQQLKERETKAVKQINASSKTVGFWFADTKSPYFAGGQGSGAMLADQAGLTNIFEDNPDDWPATTWEEVVDRNPDILVLGDLQRDRFPGDRLADKTEFLAMDPLASTMDAVEHERYIALHGAELNPSIRFVDGLEKISAYLAANP